VHMLTTMLVLMPQSRRSLRTAMGRDLSLDARLSASDGYRPAPDDERTRRTAA
jgi:hypothetical protein